VVLVLAGLAALGLWIAPYASRDRIEGWVLGAGAWGPLVMLAVQAAQILAAPVPGVFVPILAGLLYGPVWGPLITCAGTLIGSTAAYWIARRGGRPVAERLIGPEALERAGGVIRGARWVALIPLFLLPFSPSDALCFMAGIIGMPWSRFLIAVAFGRLPKDSLIAAGAALGWKLFGS
jgi:uncharacterized membrane protein YdjX (TVP38/TMEM64 family)